ncbi:hypothetical protein MMC24_007000 [Lignoscripta atroalba]|nr:hypothetical protein [Lignoscripta atroalba]
MSRPLNSFLVILACILTLGRLAFSVPNGDRQLAEQFRHEDKSLVKRLPHIRMLVWQVGPTSSGPNKGAAGTKNRDKYPTWRKKIPASVTGALTPAQVQEYAEAGWNSKQTQAAAITDTLRKPIETDADIVAAFYVSGEATYVCDIPDGPGIEEMRNRPDRAPALTSALNGRRFFHAEDCTVYMRETDHPGTAGAALPLPAVTYMAAYGRYHKNEQPRALNPCELCRGVLQTLGIKSVWNPPTAQDLASQVPPP